VLAKRVIDSSRTVSNFTITKKMSNNTSALPAIEKLRGRENYNTWQFALESYLELDGLWKCVLGTEPDIEKNARARAKIVLCIEPINYVHIQNATTAKEMWDKLKTAFEDTGLTRKVGLLKKMVTAKLENCDSVEQYVTEIITTAHQLNGIGLEVKEEWVGTILLADLLDRYSPIIMALESSGVPITGNSIKTKLLQEVKTLDNEKHKSVKSDTAYYSKKRPNKITQEKAQSALTVRK